MKAVKLNKEKKNKFALKLWLKGYAYERTFSFLSDIITFFLQKKNISISKISKLNLIKILYLTCCGFDRQFYNLWSLNSSTSFWNEKPRNCLTFWKFFPSTYFLWRNFFSFAWAKGQARSMTHRYFRSDHFLHFGWILN